MNAANPSSLAQEIRRAGKATSCPVVDMHGHYGPFKGIYFPSADADGMIRSMDRAGVVTVISSSHESLYDSQAGNERMARVVREHPDRIRGYWTINPNDPDMAERQLAGLEAKSEFVGIKLHPTMHEYPVTGEAYTPAFEYAQRRRMPVLIHTWGRNALCGPDAIAEVAERHRGVVILMGHACYGEWDKAAEIAARHENVYIELTAAYAVNGAIERMVEHAGSHKVLYGTDIPWFDPHYAIGCILYAHITDDDRHNILHRNAEKILSTIVTQGRYTDRSIL